MTATSTNVSNTTWKEGMFQVLVKPQEYATTGTGFNKKTASFVLDQYLPTGDLYQTPKTPTWTCLCYAVWVIPTLALSMAVDSCTTSKKSLLKKVTILGALGTSYYFGNVNVAGVNLFSAALATSYLAAGICTLNPKRFKVYSNRFDNWVGNHPLSRALGMGQVGNIKDKLGNEDRFDEIKHLAGSEKKTN